MSRAARSVRVDPNETRSASGGSARRGPPGRKGRARMPRPRGRGDGASGSGREASGRRLAARGPRRGPAPDHGRPAPRGADLRRPGQGRGDRPPLARGRADAGEDEDVAAFAIGEALALALDVALFAPSASGTTAIDRLARQHRPADADERAALAALRRAAFRVLRVEGPDPRGGHRLVDLATGERLRLLDPAFPGRVRGAGARGAARPGRGRRGGGGRAAHAARRRGARGRPRPDAAGRQGADQPEPLRRGGLPARGPLRRARDRRPQPPARGRAAGTSRSRPRTGRCTPRPSPGRRQGRIRRRAAGRGRAGRPRARHRAGPARGPGRLRRRPPGRGRGPGGGLRAGADDPDGDDRAPGGPGLSGRSGLARRRRRPRSGGRSATGRRPRRSRRCSGRCGPGCA